jgi:hypothetical protein
VELLIVSDPAGNRADVRQSGGYTSIPYGYGRRVIAPGESYLGVPYAVWREHLDQSVDLLPVIGEDGVRRYRGDVPAVATRRTRPASTSAARILDAAFQLVRAASVPLVLTAGVFHVPSYYRLSQRVALLGWRLTVGCAGESLANGSNDRTAPPERRADSTVPEGTVLAG